MKKITKHKIKNKTLVQTADKKQRRVRKSKITGLGIILLILTILVLAFFAVMIYTSIAVKHNIISVMELNATINVSDYVGFNLDKDRLHFGTVFPGGYAVRELTLSSEKEGYVYITIDEEFEDWIYVSAQNEYVNDNYYLPLKIKMRVPETVYSGNYEFKIRVFVTEKKVNCLSKRFFKGSPATLDGSTESEGSAKVGLTIINPEDINKSINESVN